MTIHVRDVMGRVAIAVPEDATFREVVAAMRRHAVGAVTVIDAGRRPVGMVSRDDLLGEEVGPERPGMRARRLMTSSAVTVTPGMTIRDAARLMHAEGIEQAPVVDPVTGRIAGTLHRGDVLRVCSRPAAGLEALRPGSGSPEESSGESSLESGTQ